MDSLDAMLQNEIDYDSEQERVRNMSWREHLAEADIPEAKKESPFAILQKMIR